jgi:hypothetical protein
LAETKSEVSFVSTYIKMSHAWHIRSINHVERVGAKLEKRWMCHQKCSHIECVSRRVSRKSRMVVTHIDSRFLAGKLQIGRLVNDPVRSQSRGNRRDVESCKTAARGVCTDLPICRWHAGVAVVGRLPPFATQTQRQIPTRIGPSQPSIPDIRESLVSPLTGVQLTSAQVKPNKVCND